MAEYWKAVERERRTLDRAEAQEKRILVVDDDPDNAHLTASTLRVFGAADQVATAVSAGDAYLKMLANSYDLVISDLNMPGLDGLTMLEEIGKHYPDVRLVLMTGDLGLEIRRSAHRAGVDQCIAKPFPAQQLAASVRALLEKS